MKLWIFCCLRATLAGITGCCEVAFLASLERFSKQVALATGILLLTSTGMAHAAGAYLPSSTIMAFWLLCAAAYLRGNVAVFIGGAVVATLAIGWPFGVIVFVPMGLHILIGSSPQQLVKVLLGTALWTAVVQATVMVIDYNHYDKQWLSPIANILVYNAKEGGDELYGVEPASYYLKNLLLNFSYAALLGLLALPVASVMRLLDRPWPVPLVVACVAPLYLWLSIVVPRPHKEERFLFPIYPALCVCAAMTLEQLWVVTFGRLLPKGKMQSLWIVLLAPSCLMCISRTLALTKYYTAPLSAFSALAQQAVPAATDATALVCTCGEWHRFPSTFYLPPNYQLGFLPSSFKGQLPKPFGADGVFNDVNKEEEDRYVSSVDECAYVIELEQGDDPECLRYMQQSEASWTKISSHSYLDASQTPTLHRILYLPRLHEKAVSNGSVVYNEYVLYQRK
jgi:alpha-1,2-mannosyltransferase